MDRKIQVPISKEDAKSLRAGDYVYLTGTIYTARDAAHKRMQGSRFPLRWTAMLSIIWDRLRQERKDRLVLQDRQPRAEWISMRPSFWIWDFSA